MRGAHPLPGAMWLRLGQGRTSVHLCPAGAPEIAAGLGEPYSLMTRGLAGTVTTVRCVSLAQSFGQPDVGAALGTERQPLCERSALPRRARRGRPFLQGPHHGPGCPGALHLQPRAVSKWGSSHRGQALGCPRSPRIRRGLRGITRRLSPVTRGGSGKSPKDRGP